MYKVGMFIAWITNMKNLTLRQKKRRLDLSKHDQLEELEFP